MKIRLYGLPNCDVTRKAIAWLKENKVAFDFHDYKKNGVTSSTLDKWVAQTSWEALLNKRGTTWRNIPLPSSKL